MGMRQTLVVLNKLVDNGVLKTYAIAEAVAAYCYIEPSLTNDLDVLVSLDPSGTSGLISLQPILVALDGLSRIP